MRAKTMGAVGVLLAACAAGAPARAQRTVETAWQPTITVQGAGEVRAKPDMATITVGVVDQAAGAADAVKQNNEKSEALLHALHEAGIPDKDVQTAGFTVNPNYSYDRSGRTPARIVGYTVSNRVTVRVEDLSSLGKLLDKVVEAGANQIEGLSLSTRDPTKYMDEARRKAIADAKRRAALYAEAVGATLQQPPTVREENAVAPQPIFLARGVAADAAAAAVPIATGRQTFSARVVVSYAVKK